MPQSLRVVDTWEHLSDSVPKKVKNRHAKLTEQQVKQMRQMRQSTSLTVKQIAAHFHISVFTCNDVIYHRGWKDV